MRPPPPPPPPLSQGRYGLTIHDCCFGSERGSARVWGFGRRFGPFSWVAARRELAGLRAQGFERFVFVDVDGVLMIPCWVLHQCALFELF